MFAKAVELDPVYARAYAGIADCDSFLFLHYNADVSIDGILATSAKALDLDSGLAEAHASRGVALSLRERYQEAMAEFDQATTLDPASVRGPLLLCPRLFPPREARSGSQAFSARRRCQP